HEVSLLRPLDRSARRPKDDIPARWDVTVDAIFATLDTEDGRTTAQPFLVALTTDVLVHTWDLATAANVPHGLDPDACARGLEHARAANMSRGDMIGPEVVVADDAGAVTQLVAFYGRTPD